MAAGALVVFAAAAPVRAHHSGYMYMTTPIWIEGTVVSVEPRDPHTFTTLEYRDEDGQLRRWVVEGPGRSQLERMGLVGEVPQVGQVIEFCAHPYREEWASQFSGTDADGTPRQLIEGHVMVQTDGDKQFWDPHGMISECMRGRDDERQSWLEFLRADAQALNGWCQQQAYEAVRTDASLAEYIEEIDALLDEPCR